VETLRIEEETEQSDLASGWGPVQAGRLRHFSLSGIRSLRNPSGQYPRMSKAAHTSYTSLCIHAIHMSTCGGHRFFVGEGAPTSFRVSTPSIAARGCAGTHVIPILTAENDPVRKARLE
jgi:hypothetical protein